MKKIYCLLLLVVFLVSCFLISGCATKSLAKDEFCDKWISTNDRKSDNGFPIQRMISIRKEGNDYKLEEIFVTYVIKQKCTNILDVLKERVDNNYDQSKCKLIPTYDVTVLRETFNKEAPFVFNKVENRLFNTNNGMLALELVKKDNKEFLKQGNAIYERYTEDKVKQFNEKDADFYKSYVTKKFKQKSKEKIVLNQVTVRDATKEEQLLDTPIETYLYSLIPQTRPNITKYVYKDNNGKAIVYALPSINSDLVAKVSAQDKLYYIATIDNSSRQYGFLKESLNQNIRKRKIKLSSSIPVKIVGESGIGKYFYDCEVLAEKMIYKVPIAKKSVEVIEGTWLMVSYNNTDAIGYVNVNDVILEGGGNINKINYMELFHTLPHFKNK